MVRRDVLVLALAVLVALTGAARAGGPASDPDLPPIDPPGHWRLMTQDPATTTSRCVGDPRTPLCAVETVLACFIRGDDSLCRTSMDISEPTGIATGHAVPGTWEKYRVVSISRVSASAAKQNNGGLVYLLEPSNVRFYWKAGDWKIGVVVIECWSDPTQCELPPVPPIYYILRKLPDRWFVVDWNTPRE